MSVELEGAKAFFIMILLHKKINDNVWSQSGEGWKKYGWSGKKLKNARRKEVVSSVHVHG